jgi:hypothetical protein
MTKKSAHDMTAADIRGLLKMRYAPPRSAIVFEVAKGTGSHAHRHIDAVAMDLWPSSGFHLHGFEIKVSRSDWTREIKDPMKAEELAAFLDQMWVVAPAGIVPIDTLPPKWGLLEVNPETRAMLTVREAQSVEAKPITRAFVAGLLRASSRSVSGLVDAVIAERERTLVEEFHRKQREQERKVADAKDPDGASWRKLKDAIGDGFPYFDDEVVEVFRVIARSEVTKGWSGVRSLAARLRETAGSIGEAADRIDAAAEEAHLPATTAMQKLQDRILKRKR